MSLSAATGLEREAVTGTKSTHKISRRRFAGSATAAVGVVAASTYVKPEMKALGIPTVYAQVSPSPSRDITVTVVPPSKTVTVEGSTTPTTTGTPGTITPTTTGTPSTVTPTTTGTPSTVTPTADPSVTVTETVTATETGTPGTVTPTE